jgi:hypothetical protein
LSPMQYKSCVEIPKKQLQAVFSRLYEFAPLGQDATRVVTWLPAIARHCGNPLQWRVSVEECFEWSQDQTDDSHQTRPHQSAICLELHPESHQGGQAAEKFVSGKKTRASPVIGGQGFGITRIQRATTVIWPLENVISDNHSFIETSFEYPTYWGIWHRVDRKDMANRTILNILDAIIHVNTTLTTHHLDRWVMPPSP